METTNVTLQATTITCRDCRKPYLLDVKEQEWFIKKDLHLPTRCKACRAVRKAKKSAEAAKGVSDG